jgi:hypothetical protein
MSLITRLAAAAGLAAALAAPVFAQTTKTAALNGQLNWGDVVADINVVTRDGARSAAAVATAAGNSVSGANLTGDLDAGSEQTMSGATFAYATLHGGNVTHANAMSTAQANTLQAQTMNGALNLTAEQIADGGDALARSRVNIRNAKTLSAVSSAASNNAATAAHHGDLNVAITQSASNSAYAITDVDACCTGQTAAGASAAINTWNSSSSTSTVNAQYKQTSTGAASEATADVYQNRAYGLTAATTAAANSASIANEWGYVQTRGRQTSSTNVKADTRITLPDFSGTTSISAYGVGNSTLATNVGSDMVVDIAQLNTGGVDANAEFTGASYDHGDVVLASTAIGNGFTGYVCSQCGDAALTGAVSQTNGGNILSTGSITANGAGAIFGSASAIGNSATFITTQKGH